MNNRDSTPKFFIQLLVVVCVWSFASESPLEHSVPPLPVRCVAWTGVVCSIGRKERGALQQLLLPDAKQLPIVQLKSKKEEKEI